MAIRLCVEIDYIEDKILIFAVLQRQFGFTIDCSDSDMGYLLTSRPNHTRNSQRIQFLVAWHWLNCTLLVELSAASDARVS